MCHLCDARAVCDRIKRQIKGIDGDGPIRPAIIREVLADALKTLTRFHNAEALSSMVHAGVHVDVSGMDAHHESSDGETIN